MHNLDLARKQLYEKGQTLVIAKRGIIIYETRSDRISGFLEAIDKLKIDLKGSCVADRVAGKAVALLCVYACVKGVYAVVLSRQAQAVLEKKNVVYQFGELVDNVLDPSRTGTCPFERAAASLSDPEEAYEAFKKLQNNMKQCS
jgi:hypothetical protein